MQMLEHHWLSHAREKNNAFKSSSKLTSSKSSRAARQYQKSRIQRYFQRIAHAIVNGLCMDSLKGKLVPRSQLSNYLARNQLDLEIPRLNLDPVYTRTDPKWYGSILDPFQFLLAFTLDRIQISTPFTLGTGLEQFHSNTWFERWI